MEYTLTVPGLTKVCETRRQPCDFCDKKDKRTKTNWEKLLFGNGWLQAYSIECKQRLCDGRKAVSAKQAIDIKRVTELIAHRVH